MHDLFGNSQTDYRKHIQGLIFNLARKDARISGYGRFAWENARFVIAVLHAVSSHFWVLMGG